MSYFILVLALLLFIFWTFGAFLWTFGGIIHIVLIIAVICLILRFIRGF